MEIELLLAKKRSRHVLPCLERSYLLLLRGQLGDLIQQLAYLVDRLGNAC